ncbi:SIMPL domain-containing protein [Rasiella sp. SM2506]|uniref:SIMPL domain-containing protein n=1 Tax=Rasiella sp. SM2506 TaxID=3423914 RepID=UPI003D7ADF49
MKKDYYKELTEIGVDATLIVENQLEFLNTTRKGDGAFLEFITHDIVSFKKFLDVTIPGMYMDTILYKYKIKGKTQEQIIKDALADAKQHANRIALQLGETLGTVISVQLLQLPNENKWNFYMYDPPQLRVDVKYMLL